MIVGSMSALKEREGIPYLRQCASAGVPYSSVIRWRSKVARNHVPIAVPGPRKKSALDTASLEKSLGLIKHGRKRSTGTGKLYRSFSGQLSRRRLSHLVKTARREEKRSREASITRIDWQTPGLVWALDDCEYVSPSLKRKLHLHNVQDASSRYKFPPLVGATMARGEEVASNLEALFERYGPPLLLKRDNGGNLNHRAANEVLERHLVFPLNSPPYYPRFNGGMERAQREIKEGMSVLSPTLLRLPALASKDVVHKLNHLSRRCLKGRTPCGVFEEREAAMRDFTRNRRKEVYAKIKESAKRIAGRTTGRCNDRTAWRLAVESWLIEEGHITITKGKKVLPGFYVVRCS